jgi:hypothetical protein
VSFQRVSARIGPRTRRHARLRARLPRRLPLLLPRPRRSVRGCVFDCQTLTSREISRAHTWVYRRGLAIHCIPSLAHHSIVITPAHHPRCPLPSHSALVRASLPTLELNRLYCAGEGDCEGVKGPMGERGAVRTSMETRYVCCGSREPCAGLSFVRLSSEPEGGGTGVSGSAPRVGTHRGWKNLHRECGTLG